MPVVPLRVGKGGGLGLRVCQCGQAGRTAGEALVVPRMGGQRRRGDVSIGDLIHVQTSRLGSSEWPGHTSRCCFLVRLARCSTDESCWCPAGAGAESCRITVVVLCFVCVVGVAVMSRGDGCNGAQNDLRRARDDPAKDGGGYHRRGPHLSMRFVVEMVVVVVVGRGGEGHNNTRQSWAKT